MAMIDIIIPSMDNAGFLQPCIQSLLSNQAAENLFHITVVNNGHKNSCDYIDENVITVLQPGKNLGWEGALKLGLEKTKAPFVVFLNDDTFIPTSSRMWLNKLLQHFTHEDVGAVGPSSNVVMGFQNIFTQTPLPVFSPTFLIGFCFMVRRSAIGKAGGIDDSMPGGDDFDMSIRLRKEGFRLVVDKNVFVYHHGFKTGTRVMGEANQRNGWNSFEQWEKTNHALIKKHGFITWWETYKGAWNFPMPGFGPTIEDSEGNEIRKFIKETDKVADLGCGANKTVSWAVGVDMIQKDQAIDTLTGSPQSSADVQADVSQPLPLEKNSFDVVIARHIMEHLMDSVTVLKQWKEIIKPGGRLIIAVPNNTMIQSIPMNIEHVHAWNPEGMKSMLEAVGFRVIEQIDPHNYVSFITVAERI